jgi:hypothetical protein
MRGTRSEPHRRVGGGEVVGRRGGAVVVGGGGARWGCAPARERRRGELGEGWDAPGVLGWGLL